MRLTAAEKQEIIKLVERSEIGVNRTLLQLGINKSTFYKWYKAYLDKGSSGLEPKHSTRQCWNTIPQGEKNLVVEIALEYTELSPRELSCKLSDAKGIFISESSVYRILKARGLITSPSHILLTAGNEFSQKTCFVHEMWQTDFTCFKILGWGWYYLSTKEQRMIPRRDQRKVLIKQHIKEALVRSHNYEDFERLMKEKNMKP